MSNKFIDYLNSMNNANSSNINSLAESQVLEPFYHKIQVERSLGKYIAKQIRQNKNECFILTGHAGDGKTSLLVQVLRELKLLEEGKKLEEYKEITTDYINLIYIKDMSELNKEDQLKYLQKSLEAPSLGKSSILITNTGPLLNSFKSLFNNDTDIENKLLDQLDLNKNEYINVQDYKFKLINIARVDNVRFATQILKNILDDVLWETCMNCKKKDVCNVCNNYISVKNNFKRVSRFVDAYYRYLYENDKRITIRQMLSQLSFAFTGNLDCEEIAKTNSPRIKFTHNFANLFFGYEGINEIDSSNQIKAIKELKYLDLDSKSLKEDYNMIVRNDFTCFEENIEKIIKEEWERHSKAYRNLEYVSEDRIKMNNKDEDISMRKSIRRFYLLYSNIEKDEDFDNVLGSVFGKIYPLFNKGLFEEYSKIEHRYIKNLVFRALYINNVGTAPKSKDNLPLTLKRNDGNFQNVFLKIGRVEQKKLDIIQVLATNDFDDIEIKYDLFLELESDEEYRFKLTLPIFNYFESISNGAIVTSVNPILGHGIARLNSMLLDKFSVDEELKENELKVIMNTSNGPIGIKIEIDDKKLFIE